MIVTVPIPAKVMKLVRDFRKKVEIAERKVEVRTCCSYLEMLRVSYTHKERNIERVKTRVL